MFKMVAFDMDGTIADTIPLCVEAFRKSVSPYAGHELSEQEIVQTFGLNEIGMIKAFVPQKWEVDLQDLILSILVDTFLSRISLTMLPAPNLHNTSCVLS